VVPCTCHFETSDEEACEKLEPYPFLKKVVSRIFGNLLTTFDDACVFEDDDSFVVVSPKKKPRKPRLEPVAPARAAGKKRRRNRKRK
jgi:hypothetical protein